MEELFGYIPPVTKVITWPVILTTLLCHFGVIGIEDVFFDFGLIVEKYEIWRVFTSFTYYGDINLTSLIRIYLLFAHCKSLELMIFQGDFAGFLYFILYTAATTLIFAPVLNLFFLSESFSMAITYLLCKRHQEGNVGFVFMPMVRVPSPYFPYLCLMLVGFNKTVLLGMMIAHVYYYFEDVLPQLPSSSGFRLFRTPKFVVWLSKLIE